MTTHNGRRLDKIRDRLDPIQVPDMKVETDPGPDEGFTLTTYGEDGKPISIHIGGVSIGAIT